MFAMLFVTRPEIRYQLSPKMLRSLMKKLGSYSLSELLQLEEIFQGHMCLINDHFEELKVKYTEILSSKPGLVIFVFLRKDRRKDVVDVVRDRLSWKEFSVDWGGDYIPSSSSSSSGKTDRERALTAMPDTMLATKVSKMRKSIIIIMKDYIIWFVASLFKYCSSDEDEKYIYVYSSSSGGEEDDAWKI